MAKKNPAVNTPERIMKGSPTNTVDKQAPQESRFSRAKEVIKFAITVITFGFTIATFIRTGWISSETAEVARKQQRLNFEISAPAGWEEEGLNKVLSPTTDLDFGTGEVVLAFDLVAKKSEICGEVDKIYYGYLDNDDDIHTKKISGPLKEGVVNEIVLSGSGETIQVTRQRDGKIHIEYRAKAEQHSIGIVTCVGMNGSVQQFAVWPIVNKMEGNTLLFKSRYGIAFIERDEVSDPDRLFEFYREVRGDGEWSTDPRAVHSEEFKRFQTGLKSTFVEAMEDIGIE